MKAPRPAVVDFETESIQARPSYPPAPIGVSIKWPGKKPKYHAWGHRAGGNNATMKGTKAELKAAIHHPDGCLFQNAKFDLDVAETHFGIAPPVWHNVQDTLFLLFLKDPDVGTLELKPAAERILGWLPEERDEVKDWLMTHQPVPGVKISDSRKSEHYFMNYLAHAPGDVVGRYANGDTGRCDALFKPLWTEIVERNMGVAYDRERRLAPHMLAAERRGLRVDVPALERDVVRYEAALASIDAYLRKRLKVGESVNLDSDKEMLPVLLSGGWVDEAKLLRTKKTKAYSTAKGSLELAMADRALSGTFRYRAQLKTCLQTYMRSWLTMARGSQGFIYGSWNQTRNAEGTGVKGTRTGRMSVTWFMNMPKEFAPIFRHEAPDNKRLPACPVTVDATVDGKRVKGDVLPPLPLCRGYVLPYNKGDVIIDRDYVQQEPHILAHFEAGELMHQYQADPWLDVHDNAKAYIQQVYGLDLPRKNVKIINLGIIYGKGVGKMAEEMGETVERTKQVRDLILGLYPGLEGMNTDMKALSAAGEPLVTWGGREYFCEPPLLFEGRVIKFEYKMVNRLVQGSAADCTKEAIIRYHEMAGPEDVFMLQVHDQMAASAPRKRAREAMELMRVAMETIKFDVAMVTEGDVGENWGALRPYDVGLTKWRELEKKGKTKGVTLRTERNMSECLPGY